MKTKLTALIFFLFAPFFFCGCPAELKLKPCTDGTFYAEFHTGLGEQLVSAIQDLASLSRNILGEENSGGPAKNALSQIIDTKKIKAELDSGFFSNSAVKFNSVTDTSIDFIATAQTKKTFPKTLLQQESLKNGKTRLSVFLNSRTVQSALLQDETTLKTFADILMAPLITGEEMTSAEYRELLEDLYGKKVSGELLSGDFKITLCLPDGKEVSQSLSVPELLSMTDSRTIIFEY